MVFGSARAFFKGKQLNTELKTTEFQPLSELKLPAVWTEKKNLNQIERYFFLQIIIKIWINGVILKATFVRCVPVPCATYSY